MDALVLAALVGSAGVGGGEGLGCQAVMKVTLKILCPKTEPH